MKVFKIFNPIELEITFGSFTKFTIALFRLVFFDFNILFESASLKEKIFYHAKLVYFKFCVVAFAASIFLLVGHFHSNMDNFLVASSAIPNVVTVVMICLKALIVHLNKDAFRRIFIELAEVFNRRKDENQNYIVKSFLNEYNFYMKRYASLVALMFLPITFPIIPFLLFGKMELTVDYWFPFDAYRFKVFAFVLLGVDWHAYNCLIFLLAAGSLLYALISVISMEFEILKTDMKNFKLIVKHERAEKLTELINRHNQLLDISDKLQKIYSFSFLFSFGISSLIMCFVAFRLSTANNDLTIYGFYVPYLLMMTGQIMLLCLFGQKLINTSEAVAEGIYFCGWEDFADVSLKKQFILIMMRAQKAKKLTAMSFADISLRSLTTVSRHCAICDVKLKPFDPFPHRFSQQLVRTFLS